MPEILLGALIGIICGGEDWEEIALFCEEKLDVLREFLPYENGVPSAKTFWRVFELLDSQSFAACFAAWIESLVKTVKGVVAIDGNLPPRVREDDAGKDVAGGAKHQLTYSLKPPIDGSD
ncbi:MAG: ISAs1 family transposase [Bdellovibrionales bacterium]